MNKSPCASIFFKVSFREGKIMSYCPYIVPLQLLKFSIIIVKISCPSGSNINFCVNKLKLNSSYKINIINSARLLLKSFGELPSQFASVSRTQEEWLLLVISVIYLPSAKPQKLLWRYSILNAHCKHMTFLFKEFFKAETA